MTDDRPSGYSSHEGSGPGLMNLHPTVALERSCGISWPRIPPASLEPEHREFCLSMLVWASHFGSGLSFFDDDLHDAGRTGCVGARSLVNRFEINRYGFVKARRYLLRPRCNPVLDRRRFYGFPGAGGLEGAIGSDRPGCLGGRNITCQRQSISPFAVSRSHPSRKNKDAARVGHPLFTPLGEMLYEPEASHPLIIDTPLWSVGIVYRSAREALGN
jgi:hypothetical protein